MLESETFLFFGGTGSLGYKFIERNVAKNKIVNFSRDECKHWHLELKHDSVLNIIGDVRDKSRVRYAIKATSPTIVIIASAMKHVDRCEFATSECIATNVIGIKNILEAIEEHSGNIKCAVFVSTDKACSPVNAYGMSKALSEKMVVEHSTRNLGVKYNIVRYGNVLNSRGSIIPLLHHVGSDPNAHYMLTDSRMTRFIMTLTQSCELIEYAIKTGKNGETIVPTILSMRLVDLFEIFSELYGKEVTVGNLRPGEKLYESLINGTQYMVTYKQNGYYHIVTNNSDLLVTEQVDLNSNLNVISKEKLKSYLTKQNLLTKPK